MKRYLTYFRALAFFEGLEDDQILLLSRLVRRRLGDGDVLCRAGDEAGPSWIVVRGSLEVLSAGERRIAVIRAGEAFGLPSLFSDAPRSLSARAVGETWLFEIDRSVFGLDCASEGPFGGLLVQRVACLLAGQLRQMDGILIRLEAALRPRQVPVPVPVRPAPAAVPAPPNRSVGTRPVALNAAPRHGTARRDSPRHDATDAELLEWIGEVAERSGLPDLDSIKVVTSAEIPIRPVPFGPGRP